jgi:hypothetical protein
LFYRGLTLFDLPDEGRAEREPASHAHARLEVHGLVGALGIGALDNGVQDIGALGMKAQGPGARVAAARP